MLGPWREAKMDRDELKRVCQKKSTFPRPSSEAVRSDTGSSLN